MKFSLKVFGIPVLTAELTRDEPAQFFLEEEPEDEEQSGAAGGSTHNFERDLYPPDDYTHAGFGFGTVR